MSGQPTLFGRIVKWLVIPAILAAVGYFLVGPNLGKDALDKVPGINDLRPKKEVEPPPAVKSEAPEVEISVRPADEP